MQLAVTGFKELERFRKDLARQREKILKPSLASGADKAGRALRKGAYNYSKLTTELPARPLGNRFKFWKSDRRKPINNIHSAVSVLHGNKFSASYKNRGDGPMWAKASRRGVKVGRKMFSGAWISMGAHGPFVGRRVGKSAYPIVFPAVDMRPSARYAERLRPKASGIMEREIASQVEKRLQKLVRT